MAMQAGNQHRATIRQQQSRPCSRHRVHFHVLSIHKEYSKGGISADRKPSNVLLTTPEDIVIECLTLMRKGQLSELAPYIPQQLLAAPGAAVNVAGVLVHEQGPLARCAPFMDTAARRVLPGHLLRRARILSSLQLGGSCLLRVSLTACTGEELLLNWKLGLAQLPGMASDTAAAAAAQQLQTQQQQQPQAQEDHSILKQDASCSSSVAEHNECAGVLHSNSSASGSTPAAACWQLVSCKRDSSSDAETLPKGPHPRNPPELVVLAQLHALQQQDVIAATGFNMLGRHASGSGWDAHLAAFKHLLSQPHYRLLCEHSRAELCSSALPAQRHFLQEVLLYRTDESSSRSSVAGGGGSSDNQPRAFLWRLGMSDTGCWAVRSIEVL